MVLQLVGTWNTGLAAYLDLALIFLLLRLSLRIRFFLHLALMTLVSIYLKCQKLRSWSVEKRKKYNDNHNSNCSRPRTY